MPTDFTLPELGENITSGDVLRILVKPGDMLGKDQPVLELETDKVTVEISSPATGELCEILKQPDEEVLPGQLLGRVRISADAPTPGEARVAGEPSRSDGARHAEPGAGVVHDRADRRHPEGAGQGGLGGK